MSCISRDACDKDTEEDEDIQDPREDVEYEGGARAGVLKQREAGGAIEVGDESEAKNLEGGYMRRRAKIFN